MDRFFRQQIRKRWLFSPWLLWECIQIEFFFRHKSGGEISVISAIIFVFVRSKIVYQIKRCLYIFFFFISTVFKTTALRFPYVVAFVSVFFFVMSCLLIHREKFQLWRTNSCIHTFEHSQITTTMQPCNSHIKRFFFSDVEPKQLSENK